MWLAGVGLTIVAAVCQATALAATPVALVPTDLVIELPFTLLLANELYRRRMPAADLGGGHPGHGQSGRGTGRRATPSGGVHRAPPQVWLVTLIVTRGYSKRC